MEPSQKAAHLQDNRVQKVLRREVGQRTVFTGQFFIAGMNADWMYRLDPPLAPNTPTSEDVHDE